MTSRWNLKLRIYLNVQWLLYLSILLWGRLLFLLDFLLNLNLSCRLNFNLCLNWGLCVRNKSSILTLSFLGDYNSFLLLRLWSTSSFNQNNTTICSLWWCDNNSVFTINSSLVYNLFLLMYFIQDYLISISNWLFWWLLIFSCRWLLLFVWINSTILWCDLWFCILIAVISLHRIYLLLAFYCGLVKTSIYIINFLLFIDLNSIILLSKGRISTHNFGRTFPDNTLCLSLYWRDIIASQVLWGNLSLYLYFNLCCSSLLNWFRRRWVLSGLVIRFPLWRSLFYFFLWFFP